MQFTLISGDPSKTPTDALVMVVPAKTWLKVPLVKTLDLALKGALKRIANEQDFSGKHKQLLALDTLGQLKAKRLCVIGCGEADALNAEKWFALGGNIRRWADRVSAKSIVVHVATTANDALEAFVRGMELGGYQFLEYRGDKGRKPTLSSVQLHRVKFGKKEQTDAKAAIKRAVTTASGVAYARDLVNRSPLQLYPETFAREATALARRHKFKIKVFTPEQLRKMNMNLLLGVGVGSARSPRLVHLTYSPSKKTKAKPIVLVGKGITFDSGGLSLKDPGAMVDMKIDMAGAAAVVGAMMVAAQLKLPVEIHGILALAENMPSGTAIRPGDVIKGAAGKSVEINNTDAEGRLVLADALHYATKLKPQRIIDLATLTGACMVALGVTTMGLFSNDDDLANALLQSASKSGEDAWRMPLTPVLRDQLKSTVADMKNTGDRYGGAITAALFLKEFVGKVPWAHLDIAGPASVATENGAFSAGGTGVGVATLVGLLSG